ncbi:hypothetical protein HYT57_02195 [Candidatus Woesearchaeota archaeon]|nr:hypothetical protein [Candidatus Woesearchaeota archaeon]
MKKEFKIAIATKDLSDYLEFSIKSFIFGGRAKELPRDIGGKCCGFRTQNDRDVILYPIGILDERKLLSCNLVIAACTPGVEDIIEETIGKGLIVGRYSKFYPGKSAYTRRTPGEGGYSLDIPKSPTIAFELLTDDSVLDGLDNRTEQEIVKAIESVNTKLERKDPIIITPYLHSALSREV